MSMTKTKMVQVKWLQLKMCLVGGFPLFPTVGKTLIYVSELILTPSFSPFDIKCKQKIKFNLKSRQWVFHIFQTLHPIPPSRPLGTFYNFRGSCYNIQLKLYATSKMGRWSSVSKSGNCWELLLAFVTESFVLDVIGPLDLTLKRIGTFGLRQ